MRVKIALLIMILLLTLCCAVVFLVNLELPVFTQDSKHSTKVESSQVIADVETLRPISLEWSYIFDLGGGIVPCPIAAPDLPLVNRETLDDVEMLLNQKYTGMFRLVESNGLFVLLFDNMDNPNGWYVEQLLETRVDMKLEGASGYEAVAALVSDLLAKRRWRRILSIDVGYNDYTGQPHPALLEIDTVTIDVMDRPARDVLTSILSQIDIDVQYFCSPTRLCLYYYSDGHKVSIDIADLPDPVRNREWPDHVDRAWDEKLPRPLPRMGDPMDYVFPLRPRE